MNPDISSEEMAGLIQQLVNVGLALDIADPPHGCSFELTAPATGQRFRVAVAEISAAPAVDAVIATCGR